MGNCGSAAKVTSDLWKEYDEQAKVLGCSTATLIGEAFGVIIDIQECLELADKADEMTQRMISFWNDNADNWAKIGPRRLAFGENQQGTLRGTFGRIFISPTPMAVDEVTVRVRKRDGRGKASLTVCKVDSEGRPHKLWDTLFEPGKDNIGERKSRTLDGVRGHFLQIHLDGKSATRRFAYSLRATAVAASPAPGVYTIRQRSTGRFLDAHPSSDHDFSVVTRSDQNNDTQRWILSREDGAYTIQQKSTGRFLDAHQTTDNDFSAVTRRDQNNDTQRWLLKRVGNSYTIQQKNSRRFLDAYQTSKHDFSAVTRKEQGNDTQRWLIEEA